MMMTEIYISIDTLYREGGKISGTFCEILLGGYPNTEEADFISILSYITVCPISMVV